MESKLFCVEQRVKLHTNDEWNGLNGVIREITDSTIAVLCVKKPYYRYYIKIEEAENILEVINL